VETRDKGIVSGGNQRKGDRLGWKRGSFCLETMGKGIVSDGNQRKRGRLGWKPGKRGQSRVESKEKGTVSGGKGDRLG
jgi:hypothetical protein